MNRGFYAIMAAQFFSSLADNALFITTIAVLAEISSSDWITPFLKIFFVFSYVLLAAFVGTFADSLPKGRVMLITNMLKTFGCLLMFFNVHPVIAYTIVGFGAAAYSPAKYGILPELLPPAKLISANSWIEALTMASIIFGTVLGGALVSPNITTIFLQQHIPIFNLNLTTPTHLALTVIGILYIIAAIFNLKIPDTGARYPGQVYRPRTLIIDFANCCSILWKDKLGQISLAVTTLFWGAGTTLQFIVLQWAKKSLGMPLSKAAILQGTVAFGVAIGAGAAARTIPLKKSLKVLPIGIFMGLIVIVMPMVHSVLLVHSLLIIIGILSGYFTVPMNAILQYRGHMLMNAGHSIAVQNFNENLSILSMLLVYALMIKINLAVNVVIFLLGLFITGIMILIIRKHIANQREYDSVALIGEVKNRIKH